MMRQSHLLQRSLALRFLASCEGGALSAPRGLALLLASFLVLAMTANWSAGSGAAAAKPTQEIRGWAITNLIRFSYWPENAYEDADEPTRVCAPPGEVILPVPHSGSAGAPALLHGRRVILREIEDYSDLERCHVVYFPSSEMETFKIVCEELRGKPVAFVSDVQGFASQGGSFELMIKENNAFFRFNRATLMESGIDLAQALMRMGSMPAHQGGAL